MFGVSRRSAIFLKREEPLTDVIQRNEQTQTHQHGSVFLNRQAHSVEQMACKRLCDAVGNAVADGDVCREAENNVEAALLVLEGVVLVQKVTQNAAEKIV